MRFKIKRWTEAYIPDATEVLGNYYRWSGEIKNHIADSETAKQAELCFYAYS